MTLEEQIFAALGPLVSGRAYPDTFPQTDGKPNPWPAIRYVFIDGSPDQTVCGSGTDTETDFRIQIDGVAAKGVDRDVLRLQIMNAMAEFPITATCDSWNKSFDSETKGYRIQLDYLIQPNSD